MMAQDLQLRGRQTHTVGLWEERDDKDECLRRLYYLPICRPCNASIILLCCIHVPDGVESEGVRMLSTRHTSSSEAGLPDWADDGAERREDFTPASWWSVFLVVLMLIEAAVTWINLQHIHFWDIRRVTVNKHNHCQEHWQPAPVTTPKEVLFPPRLLICLFCQQLHAKCTWTVFTELP